MRFPGHRLIEAASRLVPARRREAWRDEWEAEVAYAWRRMEEAGQSSSLGRFRLRVRPFPVG